MKSQLPRTIAVLLLAVLSTGCLVQGREVAQGSFARTLKVTGPVDLDTHTSFGNIHIH